MANLETRYQRDMSRLQTRLKRQTQREERERNRLASVQEQLDSFELKAPADGLVQYEKIWDGVRKSKVRPGMRVWPSHPLLSLSNTTEVYIELPLPERYIYQLQPDMAVQVVIPSEGNKQWRGRVTEVGNLLEPIQQDLRPGSIYANQETTQEQVLPIRVVVDSSTEQRLKPGAVAQIIFPFER